MTSRAMTPSTPRSSAARSPARAWSCTAAHAAANGSTPRARIAAIDAAEHVAGPRRRERGARARADGDAAAGLGDQRVVALQHDDRARRRGGLAHVVQAARPTSSLSIPSSRPSSPSWGVRTVGAVRARERPEVAGVGVEAVGVEHDRDLGLAHEPRANACRAVGAAQARARR